MVAGSAIYAAAQDVAAQQPMIACGGAEIARGTVGRINDGRTFLLDDGREVWLAGLEVPRFMTGSGAAAGSIAARDALDALAGGDTVVLRRAETAADRYGRLVAYAYTERDGDELFIEGEMIAAGLGRVDDGVGNMACAAALFGREQAARKARRGLWSDPTFAILDAGDPSAVLAQQGRFALVEGAVASVHESGATIYLNFGPHWSRDFAVTVQKRNQRAFAAAGLALNALAGKRLRVRGFIESRGAQGDGASPASPRIEAARPEQIEIATGE